MCCNRPPKPAVRLTEAETCALQVGDVVRVVRYSGEDEVSGPIEKVHRYGGTRTLGVTIAGCYYDVHNTNPVYRIPVVVARAESWWPGRFLWAAIRRHLAPAHGRHS